MTITLEPTDQEQPHEDAPETLDPRVVGVQIEAKLREWSVPYEYVPDFPVDQIRRFDWAQVRDVEHVADPDTVAEFRTQMAQGAVFPPIVVWSPETLTDGNTRLAAVKANRHKHIPAFVARFHSAGLARAFAAAINQQGGVRLSRDEAQRAAEAMFEQGMTDEAVAREIGRTPERVRQMRHIKDYTERTAQLPEIAEAAGKVKEAQQVKLAQIKLDAPLVEAVKFVAEASPPASVVNDVVKAATSARSEAEAVDAVLAIRAEHAPSGPPPRKVVVSTGVRQARAHMGGLLKYVDRPDALIDRTTDDATAAAVDSWRRLQSLAGTVLALYGTP